MLYKYVKREIEIKTTPITYISLSKMKRRKRNIFIASLCFISGISILLYSTFPYIKSYSNKLFGGGNMSKTLLTPSFANKNSTDSGLSSSYISNVDRNFSVTNKLLNINPKTFPEYATITGEMKLNISKLKLKDLPVKINVDSFDKDQYLTVLIKRLGHFKGTSLPDKPGNTFIYGHSTNELLAKTDPTNPEFAFTFLGKMDIGDEISIEYNGKTFKYSTQKIRMVEPEDISPIYTTSEDKSLTLMTCWPPGVGDQRLILVANQVGEG